MSIGQSNSDHIAPAGARRSFDEATIEEPTSCSSTRQLQLGSIQLFPPIEQPQFPTTPVLAASYEEDSAAGLCIASTGFPSPTAHTRPADEWEHASPTEHAQRLGIWTWNEDMRNALDWPPPPPLPVLESNPHQGPLHRTQLSRPAWTASERI